jgi:hypothetical protein
MNSLGLVFEYFRAFSFRDWLVHVTAEQHLASFRAIFVNVDSRIWCVLVLCCSLAFLARIAIEALAPSQPPPADDGPAQRVPPVNSAERCTAPEIEPSEGPAAASDMLRDRVRFLELQCDTLRAEARRCSILEAQLAAANMRVEELTHKFAPAACSSPTHLNAAAAATPTASTPFKISHRTPSSAATKSLTVRASLLQRELATPTGTPLQLR